MNAAFEKAVADNLAHPAGAQFDGLHESLFDSACAQEGHVHQADYTEGQASDCAPWYVGWLLATLAFLVVCVESLVGEDSDDEDAPAGEWVWFPIAILCVAVAAAFASVFWPLGFAQ